jgi:hypothetical protein
VFVELLMAVELSWKAKGRKLKSLKTALRNYETIQIAGSDRPWPIVKTPGCLW